MTALEYGREGSLETQHILFEESVPDKGSLGVGAFYVAEGHIKGTPPTPTMSGPLPGRPGPLIVGGHHPVVLCKGPILDWPGPAQPPITIIGRASSLGILGT